MLQNRRWKLHDTNTLLVVITVVFCILWHFITKNIFFGLRIQHFTIVITIKQQYIVIYNVSYSANWTFLRYPILPLLYQDMSRSKLPRCNVTYRYFVTSSTICFRLSNICCIRCVFQCIITYIFNITQSIGRRTGLLRDIFLLNYNVVYFLEEE